MGTWDKQLKQLLLKEAELLESLVTPLQKVSSIGAYWPDSKDRQYGEDKEFIRLFGCADGLDPANLVPRSTITNPSPGGVGAGRVQPGLYRFTHATRGKNGQGWILHMALGWATEIDWAEAFVVGGSDIAPGQESYVLQWRNIAPASLDACIAQVRAFGPVTNPTVQGQKLNGHYAVGTITPHQEGDGSYVIDVQFHLVYNVVTATDMAAVPFTEKYTDDVKNPFGTEGGYSTEFPHTPRAESFAIVRQYAPINLTSKQALKNLTGAEWVNLLTGTDKTQFEYIGKNIGDNGQVLNLTVAYAYIPLKTSITEEDARYRNVSYNNQSGVWQMERVFPRIHPQAAPGIQATSPIMLAATITDPYVDGIKYGGAWLVEKSAGMITAGEGIEFVQIMRLPGSQYLHTMVWVSPTIRRDTFKFVSSPLALVEAFRNETGMFAPADGATPWGWTKPAPLYQDRQKTEWGINADGTAWLDFDVLTFVGVSSTSTTQTVMADKTTVEYSGEKNPMNQPQRGVGQIAVLTQKINPRTNLYEGQTILETRKAWRGATVMKEDNSVWQKWITPFRNYPSNLQPGDLNIDGTVIPAALSRLDQLKVGQYLNPLQVNEVGLWDGELEEYKLPGGETLGPELFFEMESEGEHDTTKTDRMVPYYTTIVSSNPTVQIPEGMNVWLWISDRVRVVGRTSSRRYSTILPNVTNAGMNGSAVINGETTTWKRHVVDIIPNRIWAIETLYANTPGYGNVGTLEAPLGSLPSVPT